MSLRQRMVTLLAGVASVVIVLASGSTAGATSGNRVLILAGTVSGGSSSIEATEAAAQGLAVDVVDGTTWSGMSAAQFASYRAIILGDPTCGQLSSDVNAAAANASVWGPVINGNVVIIGSDPVFHASSGGATLTQRGVDYAVNQVGKTGAYITLSCYYAGDPADTPVPLLNGIGGGGFTVDGGPGTVCYNNAHIVAQSPALTGLTDATLSNWSCSVHEAFDHWPGGFIPLAIAKDFNSSYTASDGTQGPPYILAAGNIQSFPLSLSPLDATASPSGAHTVTAKLLDGTTGNPVSGAKIGFRVTAGPNTGVAGTCVPTSCLTGGDGQVAFTYNSNGSAGVDTILGFYDQNSNGNADVGEPQTTAGMHWSFGTVSVPPGQTQGGGTIGAGSCSHSALACNPTGFLVDPVNTATGSFFNENIDLSLPETTGPPFAFTRYYNSGDSTTGPLGPGWTDSFAWSLAVAQTGDVTARSGDGQQLRFTKQTDGSFTADPGGRATLTSVAGGYNLKTRDQVVYAFTSTGQLTSVTDRNGQAVNLSYSGGQLQSATDPLGRQATFGYTGGLLTSVAMPGSQTVSYAYTSGRLTSFVDVRGKTWTYTYDSGGRLATIVDPLGHTQVSNVYDPSTGRVNQQTDATQKTTTFAWDAATQTATVTDPDQHVWKDVYSNNILLKRIDPASDTTVFAVDADINTSSVSAPDGSTTSMTYDTSGNLTVAAPPASLGTFQKTYAYNANNDPTTVTDGRGKVTTYGYTNGNNTAVTRDGTTVGAFTYNTAGQVLTFKDGDNNTTVYTYDSRGNLASQTDQLGDKTTYTYDDAGHLLTRTTPKGNAQGANPADFTRTYTYDAAGNVLSEIDPLGNKTTYTYDDSGNRTSVTDPRGNVAGCSCASQYTTSYEYDAANRLKKVTGADPDGAGPQTSPITTYTYDDAGNKLTETDPLNHTTTYSYDTANRLASVTTPLGEKTTYFYDANGNRVKSVSPRGNVAGVNPDDYATTFTYDAAGRMLTKTNPDGDKTTYVYDADGNEISVTDARNNTTTYAYDGLNRLATVTTPAPENGVTHYTYDAVGNKLTQTDADNNTTSYGYDAANRLTSVTQADPDGTGPLAKPVTTYGYDANGNQTSKIEPRGNVSGCGCAGQYTWTYTFDRADQPLAQVDPLGDTSSSTYDPAGNLLTSKDANNRTTTYTYDAFNRVLSVTEPDLGVTTYTYDAVGNSLTAKDANNHTTTYTYDADRRPISKTSPLGQLWTTTYDPDGNVATTTDANGNSTQTSGDGTVTYTYDHADLKTAVDYSDPSTHDVKYGYDANGNRTSMTDALGTQTRTYDVINRLTGVTRGSDTLSYAYDPAGNLTQRTFPGNTSTMYTYDGDNRMATATTQYQTTTYGYDVAGNLTKTTLPASNGYSEARGYDQAGRLTSVTTTRPQAVIATETELPNTLLEQTNLTGTLSNITDDPDNPDTAWMVATTTSVNPSARVGFVNPSKPIDGTQTFKIRVRKHGGSSTPTARIDLYENGQLVASGANQNVTSTTGQTLTQTFDAAAIADTTGADVEARFVGTHAGSGGQVATVDLGAFRWTASHTVSPTTLDSFVYSLDSVGNPDSVTTTAGTIDFTYDVNDRLTGVCYFAACSAPPPPGAPRPPANQPPSGPSDRIAWTYDKVGNRLTEDRWVGSSNTHTSYAYNAGDELTSTTTGSSTTTYGYDSNGNRTSAGGLSYTYDEANRRGGWTYDGDSNRVTNSGSGVSDLWDINQPVPQLAVERDGSGNLLRRYVYGLGRIAMTTTADTYYYSGDNIGSVAAMTSSSGVPQWSYEWEPFGVLRRSSQPAGSAPTNMFGFAGELQDGYLRARQYDSTTGTFLQRDPVDTTGGSPASSPYPYAADRPTVMVDPTGQTIQSSSAGPSAAAGVSSLADGCSQIIVNQRRRPSSVKHNEAVAACLTAAIAVAPGVVGPSFKPHTEYAIPESGPNKGTGRGDVVITYPEPHETDAFVWEVKPNNPRGIKDGTTQLLRYVENSPKRNGVRGHFGYFLWLNVVVPTPLGPIRVTDAPEQEGLVVYQDVPPIRVPTLDPCPQSGKVPVPQPDLPPFPEPTPVPIPGLSPFPVPA